MAGHHVVWLPGPEEELSLIRRMLEMLPTIPASRVARILNEEGVPSPDAGRRRKDNGVRHEVSGLWHPSTIVNIARHPLLVACVRYGRRSMGDQSRFTADGPRMMTESDYRADEKPKVVRNPDEECVSTPASFEPIVDPAPYEKLIEILDRRAGSQKGKPRSPDPANNPLGGRVYDMACTWPMYRVPSKESFRYKCGLYQQSSGQQCAHNHVDGPLATRFLMNCIRQRLLAGNLRKQQEPRLRSLAEAERANGMDGRQSSDLDAKKRKLRQLEDDLEHAELNMTRAANDQQFEAMSRVFDQLKSQQSSLSAEIRVAEKTSTPIVDVDAEIEAALRCVERLDDLVEQAGDHRLARELFEVVNARLFLSFRKKQLKKRMVNRLYAGVVTLGNAVPPIDIYSGPTTRRKIKQSAAVVAAESGEPNSSAPPSDGEGKSLGNVNRGDRI